MQKKWLIAGMTMVMALSFTATAATVYAAEAETEAAADAAEAETEAAEAETAVVADTDAASIEFEFINVTDWEIVQLAVKGADTEEYPEEGLLEDEALAPAERKTFSYTAEAAADAEDSASFDVLLTFEGDESLELHEVDFADMESAEIHIEMGVPYLIYTSVESGDTVVTFEDEYETAVEEAGGEGALYDAYYEGPFYKEPVYEESYSGGSSSGGSSSGGSAPAENCLEGGLFY